MNTQHHHAENIYATVTASQADEMDAEFTHWERDGSSVFDMADWSPEDFARASRIIGGNLTPPQKGELKGYLEVAV